MNDQQDKFKVAKVAGKWSGEGCSLIVLLSIFALAYLIGAVLFYVVSGRPISLKGIMRPSSLIIFGIASIGGVIYLLKRKKKDSDTPEE